MGERDFVVSVDAICGAGVVLRRGDCVKGAVIGEFLDFFLEIGAIEPLQEDCAIKPCAYAG